MNSYLALLCSLLLLLPYAGFAQDKPNPPKQDNASVPLVSEHQGFLGRLTGAYKMPYIPPPTVSNSGRLEALLRAGNLYLSLQDCIALVLENNMDIAVQRYGPGLADAYIMQTQAGAMARGVSTGVTAGPTGVTVAASGTSAGVTQATVTVTSVTNGSAVGGTILQNTGPAIPSLEPVITGNSTWSHLNTLENGSSGVGHYDLITNQNVNGVAISKGFLSGTSVSMALNNTTLNTNNNYTIVNPNTTSSLGLTISQNLLQGFGPAINGRQIHIAKNNREVADLTFKLQVMTTVAAAMELYWGLVALNDQVNVAKQSIAAATRLYEDNQRQVTVGTLAPIEVTRAQAQLASGQQQLVVAQMQVVQQETILKTALSRNGVASPSVADARVICTDRIDIPAVEPLPPVQELMAMALSSRPELAQSRIQIQNQELGIKGTKNSLLPTLAAVVNLSNAGYAGSVGPYANANNSSSYFTGGYGTVLSQLFAHNFPNYAAGFNLSIPVGNHVAQGQLINDQLTLRQQQLGLQRLENQVRVDVQNGLVALNQARAAYATAVKVRVFQEQLLDADEKKLDIGVSTVYTVVQDQQALTAAQFNEANFKATYARAKVELLRAAGQVLNEANVSMDEAWRGVVSRAPSPLPATAPKQ